jgi:succinoglycan biosynthesis protein ExoA
MNEMTLIIPAPEGSKIDALESIAEQTRPVAALVEEGHNPSANRNRGITRAQTPLVGFTNAHTILTKDWAEKACAFLESHPEIDIVGGPQLNYEQDNWFARISGDALSCAYATGAMSQRYKTGELNLEATEKDLTSANLVCRARVLEKVKFDETIYPGEDPKFLSDAVRAGFQLAFSPDLVVFNRRRPTPVALAKQIYRYGKARVHIDGLRGLLCKPQFFAPALFLFYLLLLPVLARMHWLAWTLLGLYALLAIGFSFILSLRQKNLLHLIVLPFVFPLVHISYGWGMVVGIIDYLFAGKKP